MGRGALKDALAAVVVAAGVWLLFGHAFLNYDTFYALVWGEELLSGELPQYEVPVAPTPHPLATLAGALVSPLGDGAEDVLLAAGFLALGFLAVGLFRLGEELYAWPVGLLAAAIVLTRVPILNFGVRGYVDLPTVALIVWAAVLEARRRRCGTPVLVLLGLAGLLRPEAWLFAAAYWLWLAPPLAWGARLRYAALAAAAPLVWALSDLAVAGDPLWSLNGTSELAETLERKTGFDIVEVLPRRLGEILRLPELLAAVAGFVAGMAWLRERMWLPLALILLNGVAFAGFAAAGLPLLGRYLFLAASVLALWAGLAAFGWRALALSNPLRRRWRPAGFGVLALLLLAFVVPLGGDSQLERIDALRDDIGNRDRIQADLRSLVDEPAARRALERCGEVFVPNHRPVPLIAYWTGRRPGDVISAQLVRPGGRGTFLAPANPEVERLSILDPKDPKRFDAEVPGHYELVARNRSWLLYAGC
jgi:hypothetical protein